jgi:hypothetical protein
MFLLYTQGNEKQENSRFYGIKITLPSAGGENGIYM